MQTSTVPSRRGSAALFLSGCLPAAASLTLHVGADRPSVPLGHLSHDDRDADALVDAAMSSRGTQSDIAEPPLPEIDLSKLSAPLSWSCFLPPRSFLFLAEQLQRLRRPSTPRTESFVDGRSRPTVPESIDHEKIRRKNSAPRRKKSLVSPPEKNRIILEVKSFSMSLFVCPRSCHTVSCSTCSLRTATSADTPRRSASAKALLTAGFVVTANLALLLVRTLGLHHSVSGSSLP